MNNILTAITSIVSNSLTTSNVEASATSHNRMNQMGEGLECFVKKAFANCLDSSDQMHINKEISDTFSYIGNSNNPPDAMLWNGDAIEIKKVENKGLGQIQLNSSYPKNMLFSDYPKINEKCKTCETWDKKEMLYVIGCINAKQLKTLFFVYGDIYCDERNVYEKTEKSIKENIATLPDVELSETNELGRISKIDHLEISDLRIRGMWLIKSPLKVFEYLTTDRNDYIFKLEALIPNRIYESFSNRSEFESFATSNKITIKDVQVQNPQNPANLINTKLITYYI